MYFDPLDVVTSALCLIRSFPNLQSMEIQVALFYNDVPTPESLQVERFSNVTFYHLREVKLEGFIGTKPEMQLVELLLAKSPALIFLWDMENMVLPSFSSLFLLSRHLHLDYCGVQSLVAGEVPKELPSALTRLYFSDVCVDEGWTLCALCLIRSSPDLREIEIQKSPVRLVHPKMSSSKRVGKSSNSSGKQKAICETTTTPMVDDINVGVEDMGLNSDQNDGWIVCARKSKNKGGSSSAGKKPWIPQNPAPKAKLGMRNNIVGSSGQGSRNNWSTPNYHPRKPAGRECYTPSPAAVPPALKNGWDWSSVARSNEDQDTYSPVADDVKAFCEHDGEDNESDLPDDDSDDELPSDDDFDDQSDVNDVSHEIRKESRWFRNLFKCLDSLTVTEIIDPERQWHCPACKGGPGAIEWFPGIQSVMNHAKMKGFRMKLHRQLAQLLEEELCRRGTSVVPPGQVYGGWGGGEFEDKEIVWPPTVIIVNTVLEKDENDKWIGMGNQELRDYFSSYAAVKTARSSYGPQGHRGISVLIFETTPVGYMEAVLLSEQFSGKGSDRDAWEHNPDRFYPGGKRKLYGYMAEKRDMDNFNRHSHGKSSLKFEIRSLKETVWNPAMQMSEDNQELIWFKNQAAKHQKRAKATEESLRLVSEKHRQTIEENKIVRLRTKMHHERNKEEMEYLEQFFNDQLKMIYDARTAEEDKFEKIQQEQREMIYQSNATISLAEDHRLRAEKVAKFIKLQDNEMEEFVEEKDSLIRAHEDRVAAMRRKHWLQYSEEAVALEKYFDLELAKLMGKYSSKQSEQVNSSDADLIVDQSNMMPPMGKKQTLHLDVLGNLPENVIDDILKHLPLQDAVRTS
ncbi:PREDICTED: protein SUPPRESSOR OF GENE SILENCING 3-like isoform X3 [Nicotiana attenuata]|uniref:protein SUPPRESSOR OF GENE SILENCING 3-like isoform X3 n=1 Tax=Nicotiana attenuata TaxID=49451 RepID=UPI000904E7BD|nr:PREDICTED: protein SUPPRESSOR OF GENE SILENCING 3-like isoform X3 [Nicotiana attenuata]